MARGRRARPRGTRGLWRTERELRAQGFGGIAGVDEAGRGPLAGPVVAASVMLPVDCRLRGLADSKVLTEAARERLFGMIHEQAVSVGVGIVDARTVDRLNVLRATQLAMREAIGKLSPAPDVLLVDGRMLPGVTGPQRAIVGGDGRCACIAAASIVAKVVRDRLMKEVGERYPEYGFGRHKGYATREHVACLREFGPCPEHRRSFEPVRAVVQGCLPFCGGGNGRA